MTAFFSKLLLLIGGDTLLATVEKDLINFRSIERVTLNDAQEVEVTFVCIEHKTGQLFDRQVYTYHPYLYYMD